MKKFSIVLVFAITILVSVATGSNLLLCEEGCFSDDPFCTCFPPQPLGVTPPPPPPFVVVKPPPPPPLCTCPPPPPPTPPQWSADDDADC